MKKKLSILLCTLMFGFVAAGCETTLYQTKLCTDKKLADVKGLPGTYQIELYGEPVKTKVEHASTGQYTFISYDKEGKEDGRTQVSTCYADHKKKPTAIAESWDTELKGYTVVMFEPRGEFLKMRLVQIKTEELKENGIPYTVEKIDDDNYVYHIDNRKISASKLLSLTKPFLTLMLERVEK